jgi:glycogen synthase
MGSQDGLALELRKLENAGIASHFHFPGDLPHHHCLSVLARSDLYVRPTRADGDSISVREALHLGLPVVASAVGVRPPGVYLFEPGDSAALAHSIQTALAAPKQDRPRVTLHSERDRLLEIYRSLNRRNERAHSNKPAQVGRHLPETRRFPERDPLR